MTYNNTYQNGGLGLPGAGFASRGKANGLKRLSVAAPKLGSLSEDHVDNAPTPPRTSRSHLLAGLRTQPKTPSVPSSAPYNQTQHNFGMDNSRYAYQHNGPGNGNNAPYTAIGSSFPSSYGVNAGQQFYTLPEQVLAPPPLEMEDEDPQMMAQMLATKQMLALRQQALQQQLASLTSQQFGNMNLTGNMRHSQHMYPQTPVTPQLGTYQQQLMNNLQPVVQEVPGQPGIYLVYNPMTGQTTYAADTSMQQEPQLANSPPPPTPSHSVSNFNLDGRTQSPATSGSPFGSRSISPPKKTPSPPQNVEPLPPPSANAFRRGHHKKVSSLALNNTTFIADGPKSAFIPRSHATPPTPVTGTFGPGQSRAGEHPIRQPRGPPSWEELVSLPTTKFPGSKNFATRQRRQALSSLVRAGLERRVRPGSGSAGSMTPVSETELTFSIPSDDNDSDSGRSGSALSAKLSLGSLRAVANGAIGSERKASKERLSPVSSDAEELSKPMPEQRRARAPLLALANAAEKRKSGFY
ncbi:hypothetical protein EJ08DRAFT_54344 [Tothia fuscella]|uniref:Uncharacterized protein n=1 Tax=Tothia fuscella TaxID=1048955 RepID=A0A9P4NFJ2_9PEZI|nr:hypothetical protein EJ08DRAFT_54344 [Tothia fuscella]